MTYKELMEFLQNLDSTDSMLSDKVQIFDAENNKFSSKVELMSTDTSLYFAFDI
jgi:hypothetical protein